MELYLSELFRTTPFLVSFWRAFLLFVSPCALPLIPAYISYISGISVKHLASGEKIETKDRLRIFYAALMFVLGFSVVFVLLGVAMAEPIGNIFDYAKIRPPLFRF